MSIEQGNQSLANQSGRQELIQGADGVWRVPGDDSHPTIVYGPDGEPIVDEPVRTERFVRLVRPEPNGATWLPRSRPTGKGLEARIEERKDLQAGVLVSRPPVARPQPPAQSRQPILVGPRGRAIKWGLAILGAAALGSSGVAAYRSNEELKDTAQCGPTEPLLAPLVPELSAAQATGERLGHLNFVSPSPVIAKLTSGSADFLGFWASPGCLETLDFVQDPSNFDHIQEATRWKRKTINGNDRRFTQLQKGFNLNSIWWNEGLFGLGTEMIVCGQTDLPLTHRHILKPQTESMYATPFFMKVRSGEITLVEQLDLNVPNADELRERLNLLLTNSNNRKVVVVPHTDGQYRLTQAQVTSDAVLDPSGTAISGDALFDLAHGENPESWAEVDSADGELHYLTNVSTDPTGLKQTEAGGSHFSKERNKKRLPPGAQLRVLAVHTYVDGNERNQGWHVATCEFILNPDRITSQSNPLYTGMRTEMPTVMPGAKVVVPLQNLAIIPKGYKWLARF